MPSMLAAGVVLSLTLFVLLLGNRFEVNNVGTIISKPTVNYTGEDFAFMMSTNLESAYHVSQLAHPLLTASGSGNVVSLSSVAGVTSAGVGSLYGITKGIR